MSINWLPVKNFEDQYQVSDAGHVWSLHRNKLLRPSYSNSGGYPMVVLYKNTIKKAKYVHHLVLEAFTGPCPQGLEARHLDGNASNAALLDSDGNPRLIWGTSNDNKHDEVRHGTHHEASRTSCDNGHEWTTENTRIESHPDGTFKARRCRACKRASSAQLREQRQKDERRCAEPDCDNPYFGKGLCGMHYMRERRSQKMQS